MLRGTNSHQQLTFPSISTTNNLVCDTLRRSFEQRRRPQELDSKIIPNKRKPSSHELGRRAGKFNASEKGSGKLLSKIQGNSGISETFAGNTDFLQAQEKRSSFRENMLLPQLEQPRVSFLSYVPLHPTFNR